MNKRFKDSCERNDDNSTATGNLLSKLNTQDLKSIKVAIRRHNVPEHSSPVPVQRTLEDPKDLVIHRREGEGQQPIFDRKGIVVNIEKHLEERIVLKSPVHSTGGGSSRRSRSKTFSDREHSVESYASRNYSKSPTSSPRKETDRKQSHSKGYDRDNKTPTFKDKNLDKPREDYRSRASRAKKDNRSVSPRKHDGSRLRPLSKERYFRDASPRAGPSRNRERDRSPKEKREIEGYRREKYKGSPRRTDYKEGSPKRYDRNRSSRSRSPRKLHYKHTGNERYIRSRGSPSAPPKRYSASPHARKRSRSPYSRKHSPSPFKRRSRSPPHLKKTPSRDERDYRGTSASRSKIKRRSGSPYEREREYPHASSSHGRFKRRSRSPYLRKHSRSPHRGESSSRYKRRSRSPFRREPEGYHRVRSRSPKKSHRHADEERSYHKSSLTDKQHEYRGVPSDLEYYGAEGFWIEAPLPRHGFIPRGMIPPPMAVPRGMLRPGPSYVIQRPYFPMAPHHMHFRQRMPFAYNNRPYRPRLTAPLETITSSTAVTSNTTTKSTSTATVVDAANDIVSDPIIEEPSADSENVESTVEDKN